MNKIIKEQLQKVKVAKVPEFDDSTTQMLIPRHKDMVYEEGKCYILSLDDYICSQNSSVFINWNNRVAPPKNLIGMVEKSVSNMILIGGCAFNPIIQKKTEQQYRVWIPVANIVSAEQITDIMKYF